jgi:hypothetical protein
MSLELDKYTLRARLAPGLLVSLPPVLAVLSFFPDADVIWKILGGILGTFGLSALLSQLARDPGKRKQEILYSMWGGKPSIQLLRHRDRTLDPHTKGRYHAKLARVVGVRMPDKQAEEQDRHAADLVYESCGNWLLQNTRIGKQFRMVHAENINYGFRRNLWGLKPWGITFALVGAILGFISLLQAGFSLMPIAVLIVAAVVLYAWAFVITPDWVRSIAFEYAKQLVAACDSVELREPSAAQRETPE